MGHRAQDCLLSVSFQPMVRTLEAGRGRRPQPEESAGPPLTRRRATSCARRTPRLASHPDWPCQSGRSQGWGGTEWFKQTHCSQHAVTGGRTASLKLSRAATAPRQEEPSIIKGGLEH